MAKFTSRGTTIDTDLCVEKSGGNRFNLVIMAAARSREIRRQHKESNKFEHVHTNVTALLEFQSGELDINYIKKIKFTDRKDREIDRYAKYSNQ
jgi:DNA-directed RNA polymerase subunit K/omega